MHSERVSTTATDTGRKSSKPIMEKRRRARINASLAELKSLLLERIKKEGARHSKMEKADILEMTVKHLRQLQRQQFAGAIEDPAVLNKYRLGFNECATEVSRYLSSVEACDVELRARLLNHLANCMAGFGPSSPNTTGTSTVTSQVVPAPVRSVQLQVPVASQTVAAVPVAITSKPQTAAPEVNNNGVSVAISAATPALSTTKVLSGVQVVPTKLTSGEVAFVLPAHVLSSGQPPSYIIPVYASSSPATLTNSATIMSFASPAPANGLKPPQTVVSAPPPHHHLHYHHPPLQVMPDHSDLVASKNSLNLAPVLLPPMAATSTTTDNERPLAPNIANQQISEDPWRPWAH